MALSRSRSNTGRIPSTVKLVECLVRVSPSLATLIRKSADREASGLSAKDALLAAADIRPGELAGLRRDLEQSTEQVELSRTQSERQQAQIQRSETNALHLKREMAALRGKLLEATDSFTEAQQRIEQLQNRIAAITNGIGKRDDELTHCLSTAGLGGAATALLTKLRDRLAAGHVPGFGLDAGGSEAIIANVGREEMGRMGALLDHPDWRLTGVRWLLRLRKPR